MRTFAKYLITLLGGFALGIIAIGLLIASLFSGFNANFGEKQNPELTEAGLLYLKIEGDVAERKSSNPLDDLMLAGEESDPSFGLDQLLNGLKKAEKDPNVKGILLDCGGYLGGMATAEEIRMALTQFQRSGKAVVAYSGMYSELGYYIASSAKTVICNPKGLLEFDGISSKIVMYKGLFDKLGVDFQVFKAGKYKSAVEPFIQESMSAENREQITQYITSLYQYQLSEIAKNRNIPFDSLWSIAMHGSAQMPASALKLKLFDGLAYETQAKESLAKNAKLMASKAPWLSKPLIWHF